jgi:hypothetical protein
MHNDHAAPPRPTEVEPFVRNNFFYGKLMDVYHFELETLYLNAKRWMLNHVVLGWGVVCGLDVRVDARKVSRPGQISIEPGIALDKWGREVIVPAPRAVDIPPEMIREADRKCPGEPYALVQVLLCYEECRGDPAPVLAGDCNATEHCAPAHIHERYRIAFRSLTRGEEREGRKAVWRTGECRMENAYAGGRLNHRAVVEWVTRRRPNPCYSMDDDPCVPLANVTLEPEQNELGWRVKEVDIEARRIVYTNRLIADLLACHYQPDEGEHSES